MDFYGRAIKEEICFLSRLKTRWISVILAIKTPSRRRLIRKEKEGINFIFEIYYQTLHIFKVELFITIKDAFS